MRHHEALTPSINMRQWPRGKDLIEAFSKEDVRPKQKGNEEFWQAAVRWSILKKYNLCPGHLQDPYQNVDAGTPNRTLSFSKQDMQAINTLWEHQVTLAASIPPLLDNEDLKEFLNTGTSNGRPLKWSFLDCGPACQFKLHAHPNIEVIYCVQGALHEIRMDGSPITKAFEKETTTNSNNDHLLKGPDLSSLSRSWKFATVQEGEWLINEVGSIHKSFCATNGEGCQLLVLWGGSHADVSADKEPSSVDVQVALETMDQRLCDCGSGGVAISETFLPDSEKNK